MSDCLNKYRAFFCANAYWYLYIIFPVATAVITILSTIFQEFVVPELLCTLFAVFFLAMDIFVTYVNFGGLFNKKATHNDYIKSSSKGMEILITALRVDSIRRLISVALIIVPLLNKVFAPQYGSVRLTVFTCIGVVAVIWLVGEFAAYFALKIARPEQLVAIVYFGLIIAALLSAGVLMIMNGYFKPLFAIAAIIGYKLKFKLIRKNSEGLYYD